MENEKTYLQNLILNRRIVRNYIDSDKPYPDLSEISKLTIKIPTAGFSRGIEIISVEDKKNIQKLAIFANEKNYLDKGFSKWISNSKAIFLRCNEFEDEKASNFSAGYNERLEKCKSLLDKYVTVFWASDTYTFAKGWFSDLKIYSRNSGL